MLQLEQNSTSVSEAVRRVVEANPSLQECLMSGIVNYSELARKLQPLLTSILGRAVSIDAIKMALIRYADKMGKNKLTEFGTRVLEVLARSELEIRTGITVATFSISVLPQIMEVARQLVGKARFFAIMQALTTITIIMDNESFEYIKKLIDERYIVHVMRDQVAVIIVSPIEIIETPGVLAYITSILARNNVNIVQVESCHTDTVLIISKNDLVRAFQLLNEVIELARQYLRALQSSAQHK